MSLGYPVKPVKKGVRDECPRIANQLALIARLGRMAENVPDDPYSQRVRSHELWLRSYRGQPVMLSLEHALAILEATNTIRLPVVEAGGNYVHQYFLSCVSEPLVVKARCCYEHTRHGKIKLPLLVSYLTQDRKPLALIQLCEQRY